MLQAGGQRQGVRQSGPEVRGPAPKGRESGAGLQSPAEMYHFCKRYFEAVEAAFLPSPKDTLRVKIAREIDKELTDRPFYWMWVDAMNENPPDTILNLHFHTGSTDTHPPGQPSSPLEAETARTETPDAQAAPGEERPELMSPGCRRLLRIYASARQRGMFGVAYERAKLLRPYVVFVVKVSYISDRKRDFLESFAIDPEDYTLHADAMDRLSGVELDDHLPRGARISGIALDMDRIFRVLHAHIAARVRSDDHSWARDAKKRLEAELRALDEYYAKPAGQSPSKREAPENEDALAAERELKRAELAWRMEPRIEVRPTQMALVYLAADHTSSSSIWLSRKSSPSR